MSGALYAVDERLMSEKPEVRVGDKIYKVDNRMAAFMRLSAALAGAKTRQEEFALVVSHGLGDAAAAELLEMDLSVAAAQKVVVLVLAAMQGIAEDEAERRFRG